MQNKGPTGPSFSTPRFWVSGHTEGGCSLFHVRAFLISVSKGVRMWSIKKLPLWKDEVFTKKIWFSHLPVMMCLSLRSPGPWVERSSAWDSHRKHGPGCFLSDMNAEMLLSSHLQQMEVLSGNCSSIYPLTFRNRFSAPWSCLGTDTRLLLCMLQISSTNKTFHIGVLTLLGAEETLLAARITLLSAAHVRELQLRGCEGATQESSVGGGKGEKKASVSGTVRLWSLWFHPCIL